jgi:hypothetical protein
MRELTTNTFRAERADQAARRSGVRMERAVALALGVVAWSAVAGVAISVVDTWSDANQVLAFFPILGAVVLAWAIGEVVTAHVFSADDPSPEDDVDASD